MSDMTISRNELYDNPSARVPICLVLDTSGSMSGSPIEELNRGVKLFMDAIRRDDIACASAEIAMVTFGSCGVQKVFDFSNAATQTVIPHLTASGQTPMGQAVSLALDLLEGRKKMYSAAGVDYYQPWMVLMTDGIPTDDIKAAAERTTQMIENRKLTIFPIGIGDGADFNVLKRFSPTRQPLKLKGLNFAAFFEWLSKSVQRTSMSTPGEKVKLDPPDWGTVWTEL